jgi:3-oxoacyl-[acyl-carrier protein] reductase
MFDLTGKVAVVTGGSRGIGRATAVALAAQGAHVVLSYVQGEAAAREAVEAIEKAGGKAEAVQFDVGNFAEAETAVAGIAKRIGRLDILVANAGVSIDALLLRVKEEDLDRTFAINVKGSLACARAALKPMMRARTGRIIFLSSVVGEMGNVGQVAYSASKAALLGMAKSLGREYASRNITVNAIAPGFIETAMTEKMTAEAREKLAGRIPLARLGQPADIASAVKFLASEDAGYITGQVLHVNGGLYLAG